MIFENTEAIFLIDTYLLKYFIELEKFKTISEASKHLHLTQSALSRSMQKLEKILGVELFERKKNSIALNDNGKFFAESARDILNQIELSIENVRAFDRKNRTISIGACAPVPLNELIFLMTQFFPETALSSELGDDDYLLDGLQSDFFNIVILHKKPNTDKFFTSKFGGEKLFLAVPLNHKFADKDGIFLEELNGEKILLYSKIGFWFSLCNEKAPKAKFLIQSERETFKELVDSATFLSFSTNFFINNGYSQKNYLYKPVLNAEADVTYYCTCNFSQKDRFNFLFDTFSSNFKSQKSFHLL